MRILSSHGGVFYVAMALMYCFLYEWVNIFSIPGVTTYVNILKLVLPFVLLLGVSSHLLPNFSLPPKYLLYFALFMVWGLVPNVLSGHIPETMVQWMKFMLRFFFCYVIFAYLLQRSEAKTVIMKALVAIALGTVLQYVILSMYHYPKDTSGFPLPISQETTYYGPYGLLGDGNAWLYFDVFDLDIFRLTGFWFEPSNVSGFLFMVFFLTKALFEQTQQRRWKLAGFVCLGGGLLTFSNAGYLALGCALLSGYIVRFNEKRKNYLFYIVKVIILLVFIFLSVFGRAIVAEHYPDNTNLRNLSGVRDSLKDPYGGRIEQAQYNLEMVLDHPVGIGFRILGVDTEGRGVAYSGAAPFMWLVSTGWAGLFLLLMREAQVMRSIGKRHLFSNTIGIFQAWVVLFCQNFTFGSWMTPLYFLLVAMVFAATYYRNDTGTVLQGSPA